MNVSLSTSSLIIAIYPVSIVNVSLSTSSLIIAILYPGSYATIVNVSLSTSSLIIAIIISWKLCNLSVIEYM